MVRLIGSRGASGPFILETVDVEAAEVADRELSTIPTTDVVGC